MARILTLILTMIFGLSSISLAASTQVDSLIEKLVDKGILSKDEARGLKMEIAEDAKAINEDMAKGVMPDWVRSTKIKGDLRLRHQHEYRKEDKSRDRQRIRYRIGFETKPNDKVEIGAGLATGGSDGRSTNQTLEDSFQTPDIRLDYAYARYTPIEQVSAIGGKFSKPFWNARDLIFDSDLMFDGAALNLKQKLNETLSVFSNGGVFVLDENSTENYDPFMYVGQAGMDIKPLKDTNVKLIGTYYGYSKIKDYNVLANRPSSVSTTTKEANSTYTSGSATRYLSDFDAYSVGSEIDFNQPFDAIGLKQIRGVGFYGEFVKNFEAETEFDSGFIAGAWLGDKKVAGPWQWQLNYSFRRLERDAVLDIFPDSDFYGGKTNVQGHEAIVSLGLAKNVSIDFDYYRTYPVGGSKESRKQRKEELYQADLNFKF